jgi:hypothetical protein
MLFVEGLDNYDVSRLGRETHVTRPTCAEIEAGWKPRNAVHLEEEEEPEERGYIFFAMAYPR